MAWRPLMAQDGRATPDDSPAPAPTPTPGPNRTLAPPKTAVVPAQALTLIAEPSQGMAPVYSFL